MGITEALILKLGTAATRALLQSWLKDTPLSTLAGDSTDILSSTVTDIVQQRRAERELKIVAESIAAKLGPYFEAEFGNIPENEKLAAIAAVADTVSSTTITANKLVALDLDPRKLEKVLRSNQRAVAARVGLGEAATALYDFTLQEVCNYRLFVMKRGGAYCQR